MKNDYNPGSFYAHLNAPAASSRSLLTILCRITLVLLLIVVSGQAKAQYCGPNVPTFTVNLTGNPNGSWISPTVQRNDQCCGATAPDVCVQFVVTLDPASLGIIFNIYSGAVPPGALYYQINCGPPQPVGSPICLNGVGPHTITFCKPGNNNNQYIITSLSSPSVSANLTLNNGCSGIIWAHWYDEATLNWTSVYPGPTGAYNSYLNCTSGCDTVLVTAQSGAPAYVDYQVCGMVPCLGNLCDTIRVYFNPTLAAAINPQNPTICYGNTTTLLTAVGSGGTPPYTYLWSNGATTQTVNATVGTWSVTIGDASNCPPATASVVVTAFANPITANAGPDQSVCSSNATVQLNGAVTGATGGIWSMGSGTFAPSNTTLNATYTPTAAEIANGTVTLMLVTTGNGTCPADTDYMIIHIHSFQAQVSMTMQDITCNGFNNGAMVANVTGGAPPFTYAWSTIPVQTDVAATGLSPGTYSVLITDANGCTGTGNGSVTQPPPLTLNTAGFTTSCYGACNGQGVVIPSGGNGNYSYSWAPISGNTPSLNNLCAGIYTVLVTDGQGCTRTDTAVVGQPTPVALSISSVPAHCQHPDGSGSVNPSGGTPGYTYNWMPGNQTAATATGLVPGTYTVTVTDANGCTAQTTVSVGNLQGVTASIASVTNASCFNLCNGSGTGNANGGNGPYTYSWNTSPSQNALTATGLCAGNYTLYITDANGCTSQSMAVISQPTAVSIASTSGPVTICIGQSTTLSASATGGTGNYSYAWSPAGPVVSPTTTTTYTVTATDANGCTSASQTVAVTVRPPVTVAAVGNTVTCSGAPVQLNAVANGGTGGPFTFSWVPGNMTAMTVSVAPTATTTYTVYVSDNCSPMASAVITVNVEQRPVISFTSNVPSGCSGSCVQFSGSASSASAWSWNFGNGATSSQQNPQYCYANAGTYNVSLVVTGTNGCTSALTSNNMITIHPNPTANFSMGPQPTTILEPNICFHDLSTQDATSWYWNFDDPNDLLTSTGQNPCHAYSDTGRYCATLIVHNQWGCWSTATNCLIIQPYFAVYVPNAFTPDDDGLNDVFYPKGVSIQDSDYHLWIFDRWGKNIFESTSLDKGWDGHANGGSEVAQIGVYVWKLQVKDHEGKMHALTGSVSLIK
jgi:gliding motility-associated-like protein